VFEFFEIDAVFGNFAEHLAIRRARHAKTNRNDAPWRGSRITRTS